MAMERKKLQVKVGHCLGPGRGDVFPGTVLTVPGDLSANEASQKVAIGYAEFVTDDELAALEAGNVAPGPTGKVEFRDPDSEDRDPKVTNKPKKKPKKGK